ncbi:hypothetical protein GCM10012319_00140 [Comamonas sp. KCTC 72670]|nr:hypothetical protein GCM10012319_00140 [Comamonas sp. KCTC 72670]
MHELRKEPPGLHGKGLDTLLLLRQRSVRGHGARRAPSEEREHEKTRGAMHEVLTHGVHPAATIPRNGPTSPRPRVRVPGNVLRRTRGPKSTGFCGTTHDEAESRLACCTRASRTAPAKEA